MQIYWAALEKDKSSQLKNVIPHTGIPNCKYTSCLVFQKEWEETGEVQLTAIKMTWAEGITCEKKLQDLCLFTVVKRRLKSNLVSAYNYWKYSYNTDQLCLVVSDDVTN